MINSQVDNSSKTLYTESQLERIIEAAIVKAMQQILPVLTNLDNGTEQRSLSSCSKTTVTIQEAAQILGISKPKMYQLAKQSGFPAIHVGRKIVIDRNSLLNWMREGA